MERRTSIWWLGILWIPAIAWVLGVLAGCASAGPQRTAVAPPKAELQRLVAQALEAQPPFDSFASAPSAEAQHVAAAFRPVLADVTALECRAARADGALDCTLEVVLQFPAMGGRASATTWERRLRRIQGAWQMVGLATP